MSSQFPRLRFPTWRHLLPIALSLIVTIGETGSAPTFGQDDVGTLNSPGVMRTVAETVPVPSSLEKVDGLFKRAVDLIESLLFYRLGRTDREYIIFEPETTYVRDAGFDGPFLKLNANEPHPAAEISADELELLQNQGKTNGGHVIDGIARPYRQGTLDGRPIEYATVKGADVSIPQVGHGSKFVRQADGSFRLLAAKRGLPTDVVVPASQVEEWDRAGFLRRQSGSSQPPYLLSERIGGIPIVVAWLACGAVFFTVYMRFFNIWGVRHALDVVRGRYDNPQEAGEVTHFQALASALSATVGLGNIAGVTIAMTIGGPGAFFWMLLCGALGMSSKFAECTLGVKYRDVKPDGTVLGGPMKYLSVGLAEIGLKPLGIVLSFLFAGMCILASFGGGNMLQANQAGSAMLQMFQDDGLEELAGLNARIAEAAAREDEAAVHSLQAEKARLQSQLKDFESRFKVVYGVILAALVAVVIIGGIRRIGKAAEKIVPTMCLMYIAACLYIILAHLNRLPALIPAIFTEAFSGAAMGGGILGVLVVGVQRAAFSNEAGAGSAAIAHSAARTNEPIREGCVALLEPFVDTIIVCSMTALVILITGAWDNDAWIVDQGLRGAALTSRAFREEISWFPKILSIAVTLFAYSTIISWSYYGERAWEFLFGPRTTFLYKILAVVAVFVGTVVNLGSVLDFSDMMILGMAFPNILGVVLLSPIVRKDLFAYWARYRAGEFPTFK